jgi:hypothetical protein
MKEKSETNGDFWANATVICAYTREDALEDGVLVDVSRIARVNGFKIPVAVTDSVWGDLEAAVPSAPRTTRAVPPGMVTTSPTPLEHLLRSCHTAARLGLDGSTTYFAIGWKKGEAKTEYWARCHGGDNGEPVITIMQIGED